MRLHAGLIIVLNLYLNLGSVDSARIDCFPTAGASKDKCEAIGCLWSPTETEPRNDGPTSEIREMSFVESTKGLLEGEVPTQLKIDTPWCYFPDDYVGYKVVERSPSGDKFKLKRNRPSGFANDISDLAVSLESYGPSGSLLRVKIYDAKEGRYEAELPAMQFEKLNSDRESQFLHEVTDDGHLVIRRKSTGSILFHSDLKKLVFSDRFIQLNSKLNTPFVYGLGQHYGNFLKLANNTYKLYSFYHTDRLPLPNGLASYGSFPFYVNLDSNDASLAHGVFLHNSNGMDVILQPDQSITFRPIGGILDFILFSGPTPLDVIRQYQNLVGLPALPPRWSLGFHLCRYNYNSLAKTELVWQRTRDSGIPFDVMWNDIDLMDRGNDFTYDHERFKGMPEFIEKLHNLNMHYMTIFDPGLSQEDNYYPYVLGQKMDIFIKNATGHLLVGKVWNSSGKTVFPDFSNLKSIEFWAELFTRFQKELKFDGAWIDMNDPSSFVAGSIDGCPKIDIEQPPYIPGNADLQAKSLCLSAKHQAGLEYNVHNLYSFYEAIATFEALKAARPNKRPFIISRSTSAGQGHFGGQWSGDLLSTWDYLRWSIPALIEHSMYGFSMTGSDICGFTGNTNPELCARWSTLGAFYTFTRNHNDDKSIDQDPVAMGPEVVEANRNALTKRYSLIPYLYSLIHRAHRFGEPAIRAVPFEFYLTDKEALKVEYQFMWGRALMISPVVEQGSFSKKTYLPKGRWYETNVTPVKGGEPKVPRWIDSKGEWVETKDIALTDIPLFYRGGHTVPVYTRVSQTVPETVNQSIGLEVYLNAENESLGELFIDDGDNIDGKFNHLTMIFSSNKLTINLDHSEYAPTVSFGQVQLVGLGYPINSIKVNNKPLSFTRSDHVLFFDLDGASVSNGQPLVVEFY